MPIGVVNDNDFEKEVNNTSIEIIPPKIRPVIPQGRPAGKENVPEKLRQIIGATSQIEGRAAALDLAELFNISPSSVSAYANAATSTATYDKKNPGIDSYIKGRKEKITKRAARKLTQALDTIDDNKLDMASARELAGIARDMSVIIKNMEPEQAKQDTGTNVPQFVVYAPTVNTIENYERVTVNE